MPWCCWRKDRLRRPPMSEIRCPAADMTAPQQQWPRAGGDPPASALIRSRPEDFQVEEILGFIPADTGQHVLLQVRKRGANTEWVARRLARLSGVPRRAVGYAGLKDRQAVTTQWFSLDLAGRAVPDWSVLAEEGIEVLQCRHHDRKLRQGAVRANRFRLVLRRLRGDRAALEAALQRIQCHGVPNYFGPQRFGRDNLQRAAAMLLYGRPVRDRFQRGMYLSAARAWLFNRVLAVRVAAGNWNQALSGDVLVLDGRHSVFPCPEPDADIQRRLAAGELHPTGPLWGTSGLSSTGAAAEWERRALEGEQAWCAALAGAGMKLQRRALRLMPRALAWYWEGERLELEFTLCAGGFATSVLRELVAEAAHGDALDCDE